MYEPDERDELLDLAVVPQSAPDSPNPVVVATERQLFLAYRVKHDRRGQGTFDVERLVSQMTTLLDNEQQSAFPPDDEPVEREPAALLEFREPVAHAWSRDPDSVHRHPLAARGLYAGAAFEVRHSAWLRALPYALGRHFIVAFQGSVFECIAAGVRMTSFESLEQVFPEVQRRLRQESAGGRPAAP